MKIRNGFVSNSSSSSFICEISGDIESGYDMSIDEAGMYECENEHTFNEEYVLDGLDDYIKKEFDKDDEFEESELRYNLPENFCPICQMKEISKNDLELYLIKLSGKSKEELQKEIKSSFENYDDFKKYFK